MVKHAGFQPLLRNFAANLNFSILNRKIVYTLNKVQLQ